MQEIEAATTIDEERCTGCGGCGLVCPTEAVSLREGKAAVEAALCLSCGHCAAACPQEAITVAAVDPACARYATFNADGRYLPPGEFDPAQLVRLMASRRSCRRFSERPVAKSILEDLVKIGVLAPSGTNSQRWTFTILPDRASVVALGHEVAAFFERLNRAAENPLARRLLKVLGRRELDEYYRNYYDSVRRALREWRGGGRDRLFHGAPAAIVVGRMPGGATGREDSLLATQNILLAAHSMGLGSCLIGFAALPLQRDRRCRVSVGIPAEERVEAVVALGYSEERYLRYTGRKAFVQRYFIAEDSERG